MDELPGVLAEDIRSRAREFFYPPRRALSLRFPRAAPLIVRAHRTLSDVRRATPTHALRRSKHRLPVLLYKHSSILRRKLGSSNPLLQERKIHNLTIALRSLDGLVIPPRKTFSFWRILGAITEKKGYTEAMLLSRGKVTEGLGGGLCQLSNLLYWIFLHAPVEIIERHHHSFDPFPDNGRTLPFGSGATIMDCILDLQATNISNQPLQLSLNLSATHLCGALYGEHTLEEKYHVVECHPFFVRVNGTVFRYNQLVREISCEGHIVQSENIATNFAPVLYEVALERIVNLGIVAPLSGM